MGQKVWTLACGEWNREEGFFSLESGTSSTECAVWSMQFDLFDFWSMECMEYGVQPLEYGKQVMEY